MRLPICWPKPSATTDAVSAAISVWLLLIQERLNWAGATSHFGRCGGIHWPCLIHKTYLLGPRSLGLRKKKVARSSAHRAFRHIAWFDSCSDHWLTARWDPCAFFWFGGTPLERNFACVQPSCVTLGQRERDATLHWNTYYGAIGAA